MVIRVSRHKPSNFGKINFNLLFDEIAIASHIITLAMGGSLGLERLDVARRSGAEPWCIPPSRLGNVGRREMTVVLFNHLGVGVPKVLGHDEERHACLDGKTALTA
jgi:hypothetical protein